MPNPFKRRGNLHRPDDWRAWSLGLLAWLGRELEGECPSLIAFVGDIGSGKTTALDAYRDRMLERHERDVFVRIDVGRRAPDQWLTLYREVYLEIVAMTGESAHDAVVKQLEITKRSEAKYLQQHHVFSIIGALVQRSKDAGAGVHVLLDECQRPMEHYESAGDTGSLTSWFEQLKNLAEVISEGNGRLVITTTTSPWDTGPQKVRDRFVSLRAEAPEADEIQAFIDEGLKHVGEDKPDRANPGLGAAIREAREALVTPRDLHDLLWTMWGKAHRGKADELTAEHLG
jgi:hypothetical protein